jgi:hypothetical protein
VPQKEVASAAIDYMKDELRMSPAQIDTALPSLKSLDFWSSTSDKRHTKEVSFGPFGSRFCIKNGWHFNLINDLKSVGFFIAPITKQKLNRYDFYSSIHAAEFIREHRIALAKNSMSTFRGNMESLYPYYRAAFEENPLRSPNLCLNRLNSLIVRSKTLTRERNAYLLDHFLDNGLDGFLNASPYNFVNLLVKYIPVCIVTEADNGRFKDYSHFGSPILNKRTPIPLHRYKADLRELIEEEGFITDQLDLEPIKIPEPSCFDEEHTSTEALGMYLQNEGIIFIWIDRIKRCAEHIMSGIHNQYTSCDTDSYGAATLLLFQEVLLHEFFHAFFDIQFDGMRWRAGKFNSNYQSDVTINDRPITIDEETIDNALVLLAYDWFAPKLSFDFVFNFIQSQPSRYREAADMYLNSYNFYHTILDELIKLLDTK